MLMLDTKKLLTRILRTCGNTKVITINYGTVDINDGSPTTPAYTWIDFNNYIPSGYNLWAVDLVLGNYAFPYTNPNTGQVRTWVSRVASGRACIGNITTGWQNYTLYATLFLHVSGN